MKKLIICDIDGTLIKKDEIVDSRIKEMVSKLREHQIYFTVATGRVETLTYKFVKELDIKIPYIVSNGSTVMHNKEVLMKKTIPINGLKALIQKSIDLGFSVVYTINGKEYPLNDTPWIRKEITKGNYERLYPIADNLWEGLHIDKLMIVDSVNYSDIAQIEKEALTLADDYHVTKYVSRAIEIVSKNSTKATGAEFICDYLDITFDKVIAIGDHINDLELIKKATTSFAVENALDIVKEEVTVVLEGSYNDGVVEMLEKIYQEYIIEK